MSAIAQNGTEFEWLVSYLSKQHPGKQELADALCECFPSLSRFQLHAHVFKDDMRPKLASYIANALRGART